MWPVMTLFCHSRHSSCGNTRPVLILQVTLKGVSIVAGAAVVANLFESYLGAAVQGKALWLSNDIVNGIQITLAASLALVMTAYLYTFPSV